ncbi:MAG: hydrogenase maturation nickel metallochaperone HypA [Chloroflexi bacterium]|nr:MAG: hydrogenase maturation nickel metallochaperone HypA [Chloroflexota bacterium]MBL1195705.1 hydrogenase maturation nickel metallochaperone HypA [Chloroflexota bacterium]NOH12993.1 hydrogenase maturation nickel metallochaperone HypA [Chloroflexota bacterium]
MHELAIARHLLELTLEHAEENKATRIDQINIVIGQLSSFVDESIQFYWDMLSDDTLARGATLNFSYVPMELTCKHCQHSFSPEELAHICPQCESLALEVTAGDQCYLESIDIDTPESVGMEKV